MSGERKTKRSPSSAAAQVNSLPACVASPWADCRVGKRYPSLEISDGTQAHRLVNATVAGCGRTGSAADRPTEEIAFTYNRISR